MTQSELIQFKTKFGSDIHRFSLSRCQIPSKLSSFSQIIRSLHGFDDHFEFNIFHAVSKHHSLILIEDDRSLLEAILSAHPLLRLIIEPKYPKNFATIPFDRGIISRFFRYWRINSWRANRNVE